MARILIILSAVAMLLLSACADPNPSDRNCSSQAMGRLPWGYYPGYGCGPVPPAQTSYS